MRNKACDWEWDPTNLKVLIEEAGTNPYAVSTQLGFERNSIYQFIRNGAAKPSLTTIIALADFFAVPIDFLVGRLSREECDEIKKDYHRKFQKLRKNSYDPMLDGQRRNAYTSREESNQAPWPYNLLDDMKGSAWTEELTRTQRKGLGRVLGDLSESNRDLLLAYYRDGRTLDEIGKESGVSRQRVLQKIASVLRAMRSDINIERIKNGNALYEREQSYKAMCGKLAAKQAEMQEKLRAMDVMLTRVKSAEAKLSENIVNSGIEELELSNRAFNCLRKAKIMTVGDAAELAESGELFKLRGMGNLTAKEIIEKLSKKLGSDKNRLMKINNIKESTND